MLFNYQSNFLNLKKGKEVFCFLVYGRFLRIRSPTMAMAMIIAITPTAIPIIKSATVAIFVCSAAVGAGVADAVVAVKNVSDDDP